MATVTVTRVDEVEILTTRVKKSSNELMVGLNRPWEELSEGLRDQLFKEANRIAETKRGLNPGWTSHFYHKSN